MLQSNSRNIASLTSTQCDLVDIWSKALNVESIGLYDNYFDLGGDSSTMMEILEDIKSKLNISLSIRAIFEAQNIHALAQKIENDRAIKQL